MVLTAFGGANSMVVASEAVVHKGGAFAEAQREVHTLVGAPDSFDGNPTDTTAFEDESQSPVPVGEPDAMTFDFYSDADRDDRINTFETALSAFSENGSSRHSVESSEGFVPIIATDHRYAEADGSYLTGHPSAFTESVADSSHPGASLLEVRNEEPAPKGEGAVADPWETPLPAWDYSHSEWPVIVGPSNRSSFRKQRVAVATIVLLAGVTGLYFLISRLSTPARSAATDSGATARVSSVEPRGARSANSAVESTPTPAGTTPGSGSQPAETVARETAAPNDNSAQGRFSLQAAAFPSLSGAAEFAEKLKRAGVPSYVVPADLVRRGRWFRVRAGRFNSAEDAQRFAGEAQQRARVAGLTVQLIVCQYDQP